METTLHKRIYGAVVAVAASVTLALAATGTAQAQTPSAGALRTQLHTVVKAGAPGVVLPVRDKGNTLRVASGVADTRTKKALQPTARFRVGSVTKTFVATVVLQLVGEGRISLDDSVERWLPGLVPKGKAISIRPLLDMTSGLFDYINDGDKTLARQWLSGDLTHSWKPRELIGIATNHSPHFAPGAGWSYCNTCYALLGLIVEKATGHPLASELKRRITVPAGAARARNPWCRLLHRNRRLCGAHPCAQPPNRTNAHAGSQSRKPSSSQLAPSRTAATSVRSS